MEGAGLWAGEVGGVGVPILATSFCWPVPWTSTSNAVPRKPCRRQQRAIIPMRHQKKLQHLNVILNPRKETSLLLWFTVSSLELGCRNQDFGPFLSTHTKHQMWPKLWSNYGPFPSNQNSSPLVCHHLGERYISLFPRYSLHLIVVTVHISPLSQLQEKWFLKSLIG